MELALICAQQVIVLFLLIGVGTLAVKTGVLKLEHKQPLSNLLVNIVVPAMIVNSYQMEFSLEILRNLLAAFGLSILTIALGTVLVTEPGFAEVAAQGFGGLLVADIAARDGQVKVNGWRDGAGMALDDAVAQLSELGFKHLVYTDIARDGMQTGIDVAAYRHVAKVAGFPVVASGGISTLDDIRALAAVGEDAIEGAITGRALYEGNFTLAQVLAAARGEE